MNHWPIAPILLPLFAAVLLLVLEQRMDIQTAIAYPHLTHLGGVTTIEPDWPDPGMAEGLRAFGHEVQVAEQNSGLHAVWIDPESGLLHGGVDPRREGEAEGY